MITSDNRMRICYTCKSLEFITITTRVPPPPPPTPLSAFYIYVRTSGGGFDPNKPMEIFRLFVVV